MQLHGLKCQIFKIRKYPVNFQKDKALSGAKGPLFEFYLVYEKVRFKFLQPILKKMVISFIIDLF